MMSTATTMTSLSSMTRKSIGTNGSRYKVTKPKVTKPRTTLEEKIMIIDHFHRSNKPQADTVEFFKDRYSISTSSLSEWLKDEKTLRDLYNNSNEFLKKSKRKLRFKYDKINEEMDKLVEERIKEKKPIHEPFLRENWAIFAQKYGVEDPKRLLSFSHGWLSQFKKRHGLDKQSRMMKLKTPKSIEMIKDEPNTPKNIEMNQDELDEQSSIMKLNTSKIHDGLDKKSSILKLNTPKSFEMIQDSSDEIKLELDVEEDDGSTTTTTGSSISGNFLNMEINDDYINLQTNINNYESLINNNSNISTPNYSLPQVPSIILPSNNNDNNNNNYTTNRYVMNTTPSFNTFEINYEVINEGDFETFLNKYGDEFLNLNQDKYPESLKILSELRQIFKKEKELSNDKKLRELLFRR